MCGASGVPLGPGKGVGVLEHRAHCVCLGSIFLEAVFSQSGLRGLSGRQQRSSLTEDNAALMQTVSPPFSG